MREMNSRLDAAPKKSLGQHWLHDSSALNDMCDAAEVGKNDVVLEVGPGKGTLTAKLTARAKQVIAVEFDSYLAINLPTRVRDDNLQIIEADILKFDFTTLPKGYKVVANIPYYLTSHLIRQLCESSNPPSLMALLVQKEVAQRVCSGPGQMSLLSVSTQFYCEVGLGPIVQAELFTPPPKVDSQILMLGYRGKPLFDVDTKQFFRLVKAGFMERRKMLRSSLSGGLGISKEESDKLLASAGIAGDLRAQALSLADWHKLYTAYESLAPA